MNNSYDVAIIGCGTAGIFAGYELIARHPELKICVLDQGGDIYTRHCPKLSLSWSSIPRENQWFVRNKNEKV